MVAQSSDLLAEGSWFKKWTQKKSKDGGIHPSPPPPMLPFADDDGAHVTYVTR